MLRRCFWHTEQPRRPDPPMKSSTGVVEQRPIAFEQQLKASPEDAQRRIFLGLSLAYLGRKTDALHEAQEGARMVPPSAEPGSVLYGA